jgi:nucleotide-binding universal stress UspA family protein
MKILIATNGKERAGWAAELPRLLPLPPGVTIRVLINSIIDLPAVAFTSLTPWARRAYGTALAGRREAEEDAAQRVVDAIREALSVPVETVRAYVTDGRPERKIIEDAKTWPADMVVIGMSGATRFQQLLLGSVDRLVTRNAPCPVLVVRRREGATTASDDVDTYKRSVAPVRAARP